MLIVKVKLKAGNIANDIYKTRTCWFGKNLLILFPLQLWLHKALQYLRKPCM